MRECMGKDVEKDLGLLDEHLAASNAPSKLVSMKLETLRKGFNIGHCIYSRETLPGNQGSRLGTQGGSSGKDIQTSSNPKESETQGTYSDVFRWETPGSLLCWGAWEWHGTVHLVAQCRRDRCPSKAKACDPISRSCLPQSTDLDDRVRFTCVVFPATTEKNWGALTRIRVGHWAGGVGTTGPKSNGRAAAQDVAGIVLGSFGV